jgi:hypothetical protein
MASRQRTIEQASGSAPTIGVTVDERTHYAHARYAMNDKTGVIWFDPRDGREKFRVPGVPADVDLSVGERVLTHVSIHSKRACCQVVDPADHEWVVEYNIKTREVFERPKDVPDREYTAHYASSETYDTVRAARAAAGERCAAYAGAEYRNAVDARTSEKLVADGGENEADGVPGKYREVADESNYRIPPGCPHCDKSARAYYLGDVGMTEDDVFITGWVCSACETPITLYSKGKGGDFVDERPDIGCLDNIKTPRDADSEQSELSTDGGVDQTDGDEEQDWSDQPYLETSLDEDAILADCPGCHDPMLLGKYWKELIDEGTIDLPPACPDCEPEEWADDADVKVSGMEVWALAE